MTIKAAIAEAIRRTPEVQGWTVEKVINERGSRHARTTAVSIYAHAKTILAVSDLARDVLSWNGDTLEPGSKTRLAALRLPDPEPDVREVLAFLAGEGPLDGVYFGEAHPTDRGLFWWRKYLPALSAAKLKIVKDASHD